MLSINYRHHALRRVLAEHPTWDLSNEESAHLDSAFAMLLRMMERVKDVSARVFDDSEAAQIEEEAQQLFRLAPSSTPCPAAQQPAPAGSPRALAAHVLQQGGQQGGLPLISLNVPYGDAEECEMETPAAPVASSAEQAAVGTSAADALLPLADVCTAQHLAQPAQAAEQLRAEKVMHGRLAIGMRAVGPPDEEYARAVALDCLLLLFVVRRTLHMPADILYFQQSSVSQQR